MRFLLVEDSDDLAAAVVSRLALDGHGVDRAATLLEARDFLDSAPYDLILLDISLPDGDGRDFLARERQARRDTPVIMMTASASLSDRVSTLDRGADDYITKPFDFAELLARCRAVLRRHAGAADSRQHFKGFTFDALAATLTIGDETRELRARELRLLEILLSRPGQTYSKSHLIDRLFSFDEEVSDNAIEVYVGRLRRKLDGSGARLETLRGVGYRLIPE
ncbi:MAG TPA: response regulator transcription factor [Paracoccus sp. (in: a-proteobacteria)]|uniref:response regulator transcription factor n=1 Tax=uncultured Paracoccus sp. TaxID=189685 RepID=UPI00263900E2|nr:response regulator transcription factor [uncultured Paracoccus sp.]HMQ39779.1 response regulator transcription factor [Paracoccus sp. (in: a-proteobacteria)]HMR35355.1 response regulator transcription factor [Paracoccus sp. (in: a-proteobacteria)]